MADKAFGTAEQIEEALDALDAWKKKHPEAAAELMVLWKKHTSTIGHKRLGRGLLEREVLPFGMK